MKNKTLARKARRQAKRARRRGEISAQDYETVMAACESDAMLTKWNEKIEEARLDPYAHPGVVVRGGFADVFKVLWDWFVANWPAILSLLLKIAPLLLLDETRSRNANS